MTPRRRGRPELSFLPWGLEEPLALSTSPLARAARALRWEVQAAALCGLRWISSLAPTLPTWGRRGGAQRRRLRPTHLASELEVFWTGRGGSFALTFLLLSFSARALLMVVVLGLF